MASPRSLARSLIGTVAVAAGITVTATGGALAAPGTAQRGPAQVNVARVAAVQAWQAFTAREAARLRPHSVPAGASKSLAGTAATVGGQAGGTAFRIRDTESISRDTLPSLTSEIEPDTQTEPMVAIDPAQPNVLTAVTQQGRNGPFGGSADLGYATSHDGGKTWIDGNFPQLTTVVGGPFALASDSVAAFGTGRSEYIESIAFDENDARSAVTVQRSTDGGLTFGKPSLVTDDNNVNVFNDKEWLSVDNSPKSPHYGRIYAIWARFITTGSGSSAVTHSPGALSYSDDQGKTWTPIRFATPSTDDDQGFLPLIHKDGSITLVYDHFVESSGNDYETAQTSHDGGLTWSAPVTIGQFLGSEVPGMRTGGLPAATIDPVTGAMYAVWQDTSFSSSGLNDVAYSESTDGGATWAKPRAVDPVVAGADRFTPAVAAYGGKVYVSYASRAGSGAAPTVTEDVVESSDGGKTFGPQAQVGPASVVKYAAVSDEAPPPVAFYGDYQGLAAAATGAEVAWSESSQPPSNETYHQTTWGAEITP